MFSRLISQVSTLVALLSESAALYRVAMDSDVGPTFACIWMLRMFPLLPDARTAFWYGGTLMTAFMTFITHVIIGSMVHGVNEFFLRMKNLKSIAFESKYRQEILSGDLGPYIIRGLLSTNTRIVPD
jgi:hypothetical protein